MFNRIVAYTISLVHPYTVGRSVMAVFRGLSIILMKTSDYVNAKNKSELKQANPTKHHEETSYRRWVVIFLLLLDVAVWLAGAKYLGLNRALAVWILIHVVTFFMLGRTGPVMSTIQTPWLAGEARIKQVVDDITGTADSKKAMQRTDILRPATRLASGKGYDVIVGVAELADADKLATGARKLAQKMRVAVATVFVFPVKSQANAFRLLFLDKDPWDALASQNPLVDNPRPVNLWTEDIDLGGQPDSTPYLRRMVAEGDGGGMLAGGAPRTGKTMLLGNLLIAIVLHLGSRLHLIDGKAVDFEPLRHISETFVADPELSDKALLLEATKVLQKLKTEVNRRRKLLLPLGLGHVTEELCAEYRLHLEWLVIDELAVLTEDLMALHPKEVREFISLLQWLVRMGPAFGVFCILATQRPSDKSVPDSIRALILFKASLYISTVTGSQAILGKAGPAWRADWLDPTQKGVALILGVGPVRMHRVGPGELKKVAQYAHEMRKHGVAGGTTPNADRPEPVRTMLRIMDDELAPKEMPTYALLAGLSNYGIDHSATSLGAALAPYGVSSLNVGPKREKGYRRVDLEEVPRIVSNSALTPALPPLGGALSADPSGTGAADPSAPAGDDSTGPSMAANYAPEDES